MIKIIVTGGREYDEKLVVFEALMNTIAVAGTRDITIVHGGCPGGADSLAHWFCVDPSLRPSLLSINLIEMIYRADWDHCTTECLKMVDHRRRKTDDDIYHPGAMDTYCPFAGPRRNRLMASHGADVCLAFPDRRTPSYGTRNMMKEAKLANIRVEMF